MLTLALGIGLSTALFTIANALLFRGLPLPDAQRVVLMGAATPDNRVLNYPLPLAVLCPQVAVPGQQERTPMSSLLQTVLRRAMMPG